MASEYCWNEMKQALEQYDQGNAYVIPILLRPVIREGAPFSTSRLQILPINEVPITLWANHDQAYTEIAEYIHKVTIEILAKQWRDKGDSWRALKAEYHYCRGRLLILLQQNEKSRAAFDRDIFLDPENNKEVLAAFDRAKPLPKAYEEKFEIYERLIQQTRDEMETLSNQPLEDIPF